MGIKEWLRSKTPVVTFYLNIGAFLSLVLIAMGGVLTLFEAMTFFHHGEGMIILIEHGEVASFTLSPWVELALIGGILLHFILDAIAKIIGAEHPDEYYDTRGNY